FGRSGPNQRFGDFALRARQVAVVEVSKAELSMRAVLPLCVAQLSSEGSHLTPIAPHCRCVYFSVEITLYNQAKHPQFFIRLQDRICGEFLLELVRHDRDRSWVRAGSERAQARIQGVPFVAGRLEPLRSPHARGPRTT